MARTTTHQSTHRPGAVLNGCVPAQQPTPDPCPTWCVVHQTIGEDATATRAHEGGATSVETLDAEYFVRPICYSAPPSAGTEITLDICEEPRDRDGDVSGWAETLGMTVPEAQLLINALLDAVNQTLPLEQQTHLGPPGFEYVPYEDDDLGWV
jgi:hypothetical protein